MMNIVQIGSYPLSAEQIRGGVESSVYGLANALIHEGDKVDVFDCPRLGGEDIVERKDAKGNDAVESRGKLTIHRYANHGRHNKDAVQRVGDIVRDIVMLHPDIVHIHGTNEFSHAMYKRLTEQGIKVILTVHGLVYEEKKQALRRHPSLKHLYQYFWQTRAEFSLLNNAPTIIVDTDYVMKAIEQYHQHHKITQLPDMRVIPQGINQAYYNLHCNTNSNTILCVGAIAPRKGHLYTVRMFNELQQNGVAARLRIIGSTADNKYYDLLTTAINESPFSNDITLQTNLTQQELFEAFEQAKVFVLHSQEESQGIVFAEAMATGMPVVATRVGGVPDVVQDGKTGFLCEFSDTKAMAAKVRHLLADSALWQSCSQNALQAAKKYDWRAIAQDVKTLYRSSI